MKWPINTAVILIIILFNMESTANAEELTRTILYAINIIDIELLDNPDVEISQAVVEVLGRLQKRLQHAFREYGHEM